MTTASFYAQFLSSRLCLARCSQSRKWTRRKHSSSKCKQSSFSPNPHSNRCRLIEFLEILCTLDGAVLPTNQTLVCEFLENNPQLIAHIMWRGTKVLLEFDNRCKRSSRSILIAASNRSSRARLDQCSFQSRAACGLLCEIPQAALENLQAKKQNGDRIRLENVQLSNADWNGIERESERRNSCWRLPIDSACQARLCTRRKERLSSKSGFKIAHRFCALFRCLHFSLGTRRKSRKGR